MPEMTSGTGAIPDGGHEAESRSRLALMPRIAGAAETSRKPGPCMAGPSVGACRTEEPREGSICGTVYHDIHMPKTAQLPGSKPHHFIQQPPPPHLDAEASFMTTDANSSSELS
jgi:hypothetical protein